MTDFEKGLSPYDQMSRRQSALSLAHYSMPEQEREKPEYIERVFKRAEQILEWIEKPVSLRCGRSAEVLSLVSEAGS